MLLVKRIKPDQAVYLVVFTLEDVESRGLAQLELVQNLGLSAHCVVQLFSSPHCRDLVQVHERNKSGKGARPCLM